MPRLVLLAFAMTLQAAPVRMIFDTDMGNDIDDALALACIHALESRGEAKLLAVTLTKDHPDAAIYVDLVNHFYGRPKVPIGAVKNGHTPKDSPYLSVPATRRDSAGAFVYPRRLGPDRRPEDAVALLRRVLEGERDGSVVIAQVGFSTNLARLLDAPGGRRLIERKVRLLSIMAGEFPTGKPEYNVRIDLPAATKLFAEWPGEIVVSGFEVGKSILYPAASIERGYAYVPWHPVADAYRQYMKMPYDRPTWDLTSVLYAARPGDRGLFTLSAPGKVRVDAEGKTSFEPSAGGKHRYLIVDDAQRKRVLDALIELSSQRPSRR